MAKKLLRIQAKLEIDAAYSDDLLLDFNNSNEFWNHVNMYDDTLKFWANLGFTDHKAIKSLYRKIFNQDKAAILKDIEEDKND